jgi:hypothetical protein
MTTKPGYVPRRAVVQMNFAFSLQDPAFDPIETGHGQRL